MKRHMVYIFLALAALVLTVVACAGSADVTEEPIDLTQTPPATPEPTPVVEERLAEIEWPAAMRVGDNDLIRFTLKPAPGGGYVPTPEVSGHEVGATPIPMTVTRSGYTGYVKANLSAAGLNAELASPGEQSLVPGQANTWRWTVSPDQSGEYRVVISLSVHWQPDPDTDLPGPLTEVVWERTVTVEALGTLGLSGVQTDWVAAGGSVVGVVSGIPFAEKGVELLWKRFKQWQQSKKAPSPKKAK